MFNDFHNDDQSHREIVNFLMENAFIISAESYYFMRNDFRNLILLPSGKRDKFFELLANGRDIYLHGGSSLNREFVTSNSNGLILISNMVFSDAEVLDINGYKVLKPEKAVAFANAGAFFSKTSRYFHQASKVTTKDILENMTRVALQKKEEVEEKAKYENSIEELRVTVRSTATSLDVFDNLWKRVRALDLFYEYSDDRNVWKAGAQNEKQLASELNAIGVASDDVFRRMRAISSR